MNTVRYATTSGYVNDTGKTNAKNPRLSTVGCLDAIARAVVATKNANKERDLGM